MNNFSKNSHIRSFDSSNQISNVQSSLPQSDPTNSKTKVFTKASTVQTILLDKNKKAQHLPFTVYPKPGCPYQEIVNKFCQHPDNLDTSLNKEKIIENANLFWHSIKAFPKEVQEYLETVPIRINPNEISRNNITSWFLPKNVSEITEISSRKSVASEHKRKENPVPVSKNSRELKSARCLLS